MILVYLLALLTWQVTFVTSEGDMDDCRFDDYLPWNCDIVDDWNEIMCETESLATDFLPRSYNEKSRRCLAGIRELTIKCTNSLQSSFSKNASLEVFRDVNRLEFVDCCIAELHKTDLQRFQLESLIVEPSWECGENHGLIIESSSISQFSNMTNLRLYRQNIVSIPRNELCHLEEIYLTGNLLTNLSSFDFGNALDVNRDETLPDKLESQCGYNLQNIHLEGNKIEEINYRAFSNLENLVYCSIESNNISTIHDQAFDGLNSLATLILDKNSISHLNSRMWKYTPSLSALSLTHNNISKLSNKGFASLDKLFQLNLKNNNIDVIEDESFDNLTELFKLYLPGNSIENITGRMWRDLTNLKILDLARNKLGGKIDIGMFDPLIKLTKLYLNNNKFDQIVLLPNLTSLQLINLSFNEISRSKDGAFLYTTNLNSLILAFNKLKLITNSTFAGLGLLENLNLMHNSLERLESGSFQFCPHLQKLTLSHNLIKNLPGFSNLNELLRLDLSNNLITTLPENIFWPLKNLTYLSLANNALVSIPFKLFSGNPNLERLDLNDNHIQTASWYVRELKQLTRLDLQNNRLQNLYLNVINFGLRHLNVSHNQISAVVNTGLTRYVLLTHLDLSYNKLRNAPFVFPSVVEYNLRHNNLTFVPSGSFKKNNLKLVDFRDNRFLVIKRSSFLVSSPEKVTEFLLEGINLNCDCNTQWLQDINNNDGNPLVYGKIRDLDRLNCAVLMNGQFETVLTQQLITVPPDSFLCEFRRDNLPKNPRNDQPICPAECSCYVNSDWTLIIVYCSRRNITSVPTNMPVNSVHIYLDGNNFTQIAKPQFQRYTMVTTLLLNASRVASVQERVFANMSYLRELHLENNIIGELNSETFAGLYRLEQLYLHNNRLHLIAQDSFSKLLTIRLLTLHNNEFTKFPPFNMNASLATMTSLTLSQNPWYCECKSDAVASPKQYVSLINRFSSRIRDINQTVCSNIFNSNRIPNVTLFQFYSERCDDFKLLPVAEISAAVVVVVIVAAAAILIFVYRYEMQVLIYSRYELRLFGRMGDDSPDDADKLFDAFVAYSSLDEAFVVNELLPRLEGGERPFRLCLHHRDFKVGGFITNSIIEAVEFSRRTIVIMSENFASSNWCRFEFKSAHVKMMEDRCRRLIMIVLGDIPNDLDPEVKLYLKTNTYLSLGDRLFWEKLMYAMPKSVSPNTQ